MAFGKDPKLALAGGSFRQTANLQNKNRAPQSPRSRIPYFVDKYEPSTSVADTIRLVAGAYPQEKAVGEGDDLHLETTILTYIQFCEHYYQRIRKGSICSAGPFRKIKGKRAPCRGCDIFWETATRDPQTNFFESATISSQPKMAISVLDYGNYHKLERYGDDGKPIINARTNEAYFNWSKCQRQGCDACKAGKEVKHGDMRHWPMSKTHFKVLVAAASAIGNSCVGCCAPEVDGVSPIQSIAWTCRNCGEVAIDMATTDLKFDEMLAITDNPYQCPACNTEVLLEEQITCVNCAGRAKRAGLFDVDLRVQLTDVGQKAKVLQVLGWSEPRPVDPGFVALVAPVDLLARYAPDSMEYQINKFGAASNEPDGRAPVATTAATMYGARGQG